MGGPWFNLPAQPLIGTLVAWLGGTGSHHIDSDDIAESE